MCLAGSSISGWQNFLHAGFWRHFRPEPLSFSPSAVPPLLPFPQCLLAYTLPLSSVLRLTLPLPSTAPHTLCCFLLACCPSSLYLIHSLSIPLSITSMAVQCIEINVHSVIDFRQYIKYFKCRQGHTSCRQLTIHKVHNYKVFQCLGKIRTSSR